MKHRNQQKNITIAKIQYEKLRLESGKRHLLPAEYLEMLIEMDQISHSTDCCPEEGKVVSISEKHYSLLCEEGKRNGDDAKKTAETIIEISSEMLPEKPISRERFAAVVQAWGGIDFPGETKSPDSVKGRKDSLKERSS